jgi:RNA polymerase sigma factor (sigma-70 family)
VLRDPAAAEDATQHAYLSAFRRLGELRDPEAFPGWLRRIVITVSLNEKRRHRIAFVQMRDEIDVPVLDEQETSWSATQRRRLAAALAALADDERSLCDRRYHGRWDVERLARDAGIDEPAMRKRLQRLRDKLRREIERMEQEESASDEPRTGLPDHVVELLARPRLTQLPENPVGKVLEMLLTAFDDFAPRAVPELVDLADAKWIAGDAVYVAPSELHRIDDRRILRYDLTLPLLMALQGQGKPFRVWAAGKAYRVCEADATHLEAFHQAEAMWLDDRSQLDAWQITARVLKSVHAVLPDRSLKIVPTNYPMCSQAWEIEIEDEGRWSEVLAWGVFTDKVVRHLGADPSTHTAAGIGYGLERLAMLKYGIDDIRRVEAMSIS